MDLTQFDVIVVSTSGGKDSQAMLHQVVELARAQGVAERLVAVHADLGRAEWHGTRELVEEQCSAYGVELVVVARPQGDLVAQIEARGMFPSSSARYCTSDQKRGQIQRVYTALADEWRARTGEARACRVLECIGLRAQESSARAQKVELARNQRASNGRREVTTWLPILAWTVEQVWETIRASGVRWHRAYDLGMPRLSCVFCVMAPKSALLLAAKHNRALLDTYVAVEEKIGHTFQARLSLRQVRDELDAGVEPTPVQSWTM